MQPFFIFDHFIWLTIPSFCSLLSQAQDLQNAQLNGARTIVNILFRCHLQQMRGSFTLLRLNTLRHYYTTALGVVQAQNVALQTQVRWCALLWAVGVLWTKFCFLTICFFFGNASCLNN